MNEKEQCPGVDVVHGYVAEEGDSILSVFSWESLR